MNEDSEQRVSLKEILKHLCNSKKEELEEHVAELVLTVVKAVQDISIAYQKHAVEYAGLGIRFEFELSKGDQILDANSIGISRLEYNRLLERLKEVKEEAKKIKEEE